MNHRPVAAATLMRRRWTNHGRRKYSKSLDSVEEIIVSGCCFFLVCSIDESIQVFVVEEVCGDFPVCLLVCNSILLAADFPESNVKEMDHGSDNLGFGWLKLSVEAVACTVLAYPYKSVPVVLVIFQIEFEKLFYPVCVAGLDKRFRNI